MGDSGRLSRVARLEEEMKERAASRRSNLARSNIAYVDDGWRHGLPAELRKPQSPGDRRATAPPALTSAVLPFPAPRPKRAPAPIAPRPGAPSLAAPHGDPPVPGETAIRSRRSSTAASAQSDQGSYSRRQRFDSNELGESFASQRSSPRHSEHRSSNATLVGLLPALDAERLSAERPAFRRGTPPQTPPQTPPNRPLEQPAYLPDESLLPSVPEAMSPPQAAGAHLQAWHQPNPPLRPPPPNPPAFDSIAPTARRRPLQPVSAPAPHVQARALRRDEEERRLSSQADASAEWARPPQQPQQPLQPQPQARKQQSQQQQQQQAVALAIESAGARQPAPGAPDASSSPRSAPVPCAAAAPGAEALEERPWGEEGSAGRRQAEVAASVVARWGLWARKGAANLSSALGGESDGARLLPTGSADSEQALHGQQHGGGAPLVAAGGVEPAAAQPRRLLRAHTQPVSSLLPGSSEPSTFESVRAKLRHALPAAVAARARRWAAQARASPLPTVSEHTRSALRKHASRARLGAGAAASAAAGGCAVGGARCMAGLRSAACRRAARHCACCLLLAVALLAYPFVVCTNYLSLACSELRLEGLRLEHACETSMTISVNVSIASASRYSISIADLDATILTGTGRPLAAIGIPGDFEVQHGRHVYPATVQLSILDMDELLRTLRSMAASLDKLSPLGEAYSAAATIISGGAEGWANGTGPAPTVDVAGADSERPQPEEHEQEAAAEPGADGAARESNSSSADGAGDSGFWHISMAMTIGSRVLFNVPLGGRVAFVMEVSETAARKMKRAIADVQALAGCGAKGGLDFDLGGDPLGFRVWPPELLELKIGEVSKAGIHVSGTVRLSLSGPLAIDLFPALSVQLCSAPDAFLRNAGEDGVSPSDARGGAVDVGAGQIGLGRASQTIHHAVASTHLNWTESQVLQYRRSHASYAEGCIATVATQPFALEQGAPFDLSFDLAVPFYGNSSARFYGPLYFAEEISRGGALVVRGSFDDEIAELGSNVFNKTYVERQGRATSDCFLQRVMQEVRVRAHLLRILPDAAPYIRDALLGASCMAGVFLHYFAHDNSTALNDDRVLEDCFAFMESSMAFGLDPGRPKSPPHNRSQPANAHQPPGVRVPRPLSASFRPSTRDLSGRVLYRFVPVAGALGVERAACRWLNQLDTSRNYYRARSHISDVFACESACIKLKDCWGINFEQETGRCELWNRVPRATAVEEGSMCLALEPQGSAFAFVAPSDGAQADANGAPHVDDDGWLALLAGAANHSLVESGLPLSDAEALGPSDGDSGAVPLSEEDEDWWQKADSGSAGAGGTVAKAAGRGGGHGRDSGGGERR